MNMAELAEVHGRAWEDVDVSLASPFNQAITNMLMMIVKH